MPAKSAKPDLVAVESFFADVAGAEVFVHVGDQLPADHETVKGREMFFQPVPVPERS